MASALAVSGLAEKTSAQTLEDDQLSYRFSKYDEDALPDGQVQSGDPVRFQIETQQFRLVKNLGDQYSLTFNAVHETMSGSSPWFVQPDSVGKPLQILSGATIEDQRNEFRGKLTRLDERGSWSVELGVSDEDDYKAKSLSVARSLDNEDKSRTWSFGASLSFDDINPTDAPQFGRVISAEKDSYSIFAGLAQIVNRNTLLQLGLSVSTFDGFLTDPYKRAFVNSSVRPEARPGSKNQYAASARLRYFVNDAKAAVHLDYRYYLDDWSVEAHTLEFSWKQRLPSGWRLSPAIRYHSQESASFYAPYFTDSPASGFYSSDYRLATYGALSYKISLNKTINDWDFIVSAELYDSKESLAISGNKFETPGLVDFRRFTAGFNYRF
jgi:hypothetical protein